MRESKGFDPQELTRAVSENVRSQSSSSFELGYDPDTELFFYPGRLVKRIRYRFPQAEVVLAPKVEGRVHMIVLNLGKDAKIKTSELEKIIKETGVETDFKVDLNENGNYVLQEFRGDPPVEVVDPGEFVITGKPVLTGGLEECTAFAFHCDGQNFMTHVTAQTNVDQIIDEIKKDLIYKI